MPLDVSLRLTWAQDGQYRRFPCGSQVGHLPTYSTWRASPGCLSLHLLDNDHVTPITSKVSSRTTTLRKRAKRVPAPHASMLF